MKLRSSNLLIILLIFISLLVVLFPYHQYAFAVEATLPAPPRMNQPPRPRDDTTVYLPLVSSISTVAPTTVEHPPASSILAGQVTQNHSGNAAVAPPLPDNQTFVADTGGWLDQYLKRADVPGGLLTFNIGVNAPVLPATSLDPTGNLTLAGFAALVQNKTLPQYAFLTLQIWDVDHDADGCAEINQLFVNGQPVYDVKSAAPAYLASGNDKWQTWTIGFPASVLKYPTAAGVNGQSPVAVANQIAIEIDTLNCFRWDPWAMQVDWGAIALRPNLNYPLFFVHGWNGNQDTFSNFEKFAGEQGIQSYQADLDYGIEDMDHSTAKFYSEIQKARKQLAVNKMNVFAHSRGGLFTRAALRENLFLAYIIDSYVTFGTPHHGVWFPKRVLSTDYPWIDKCQPPNNYANPNEYVTKCQISSESLTPPEVRIFNYGDACKLNLEAIPHAHPLPGMDQLVGIWEGCEPQWTLTESEIPAYTIVGGPLDVKATSATFPWVAWANGEYPFPQDWHVDGLFPTLTHSSVKEEEGVYNYVIALLNSSPTVTGAQATQESSIADQQAMQQAQSVLNDEEQPLFWQTGTVDANSLLTFSVPIQTVTNTIFTLVTTNSVTITLVTPNNTVIDPLVANSDPLISYTVESNGSTDDPQWFYQYQIQDPVDGVWQIHIQAVDEASFTLYTDIRSSISLLATSDAVTYTPGQTVQVQVGLVDGDILQSGAIITGTLLLPDGSSSPVTFYDDGTHGDDAAGNHFYAAQLTAPAINGHPCVVIQATKGNILRLTEVNFIVAAQTATFQQVTDEAVVDTNNNTYVDELVLDVALNILTAGDYVVSGLLADSSGTTLASATYSTIDTASSLAAGARTVSLRFDGKALRKAGVNGPYQLKALTIKYYDPAAYESFTVARDTNVYTTANYNANQFEGELVQLSESTEAVVDDNADGLYDRLTISVTLDLLLPGAYSWFGEVVDANGDHVTGVEGEGDLDNQTPAVFTIAGWQLRNAALDGPYRLTNVYFTKQSTPVSTHYFDDVHTTGAYQATDFGALPLVLNDPTALLVDFNNNAQADHLVISTTVDALAVEGQYTWSGRLVDPNGVEVATGTGAGLLYDGKSIAFTFVSLLLYEAGLDGPYTLRDVTLTNQADPTVTALFPVLYTTPAYQLA